ncbi:MAG: hypothetical protein Kow0059_09360 [Candidatus Sumerlaeia bacterium]
MNWFTRFLLVFVSLFCLAQGLYVISWVLLGPETVQGFLSAYYLPTHATLSDWQLVLLIVLLLTLSWACMFAVLKSVRFENIVFCKPIAGGGDTLLLTDRAIVKTVLRAFRRMPEIHSARAEVFNTIGGGIVIKIYIYWWAGTNILESTREVKRRTRMIFERVLGIKNLKDVKVVTKGLKFNKESDVKINKVAAAPASGTPPAAKVPAH